MKLLPFAATLLMSLAVMTAWAAEPLRLEIISVQETQGQITASIALYGPDGLPLSSVPAGSVKASLDGTPLAITGVQPNTTARAPIAVVLMVDVSGSMAGDPIVQARRALTDFVGSLEPDDQVAVFAFDTNVRLLQDFTTDKALGAQAVARLTPLGDTALYDAVIQASRKAAQATAERKLVVLLTDGVATVNTNQRAASLDEVRAAGATFVTIGLGADLDRAYLGEVASASGGRFLEAPTPAALKQTYANLAAAIRTYFTVAMAVPEAVDRTVPARLSLNAAVNGASASAETILPALAGATPPPINFSVTGVAAGMKINTPVTLQAVIPTGVADVSVEYKVDDQTVSTSSGPPYSFQLDPSSLGRGNHLVYVLVTDPRGRRGERQIGFEVVGASASGGGISPLLLAVPILAVAGGGAYTVLRRRKPNSDGYSKRIKPWQGKIPDAAGSTATPPPGEWFESRSREPRPAPAERVLGRVVVMNESAIRTGGLDGIREYEIGSNPLTLGTDAACNIVVQDPEGRIGGEEARIWVQRGRLVYHKLTTLSAMATEGVTSGWQFLDHGEDLRVGPYQVAFQLATGEMEPEDAEMLAALEAEAAAERPSNKIELWPLRPDEAGPLGASSD